MLRCSFPGVFTLLVMVCLFSCESKTEEILGSDGTTQEKLVLLQGLGFQELKKTLHTAVREWERVRKDRGEQAERIGLLLETLLKHPEGRPVFLDSYAKIKKCGAIADPIWRGFSSIATHHFDWLIRRLQQAPEGRLAAIMPDLLAAAAIHGGKVGKALFKRLLEDYALQPHLFQVAFTRMPLKDFQRLADFSVKTLRLLGIARVSELLSGEKDYLVGLKRLVRSGYPVLAVFLAEKLFASEYRRYRELPRGNSVRRKIRNKALKTYWLLTELRGHFKKRREGEQRAYAVIVKKFYNVQSGQ